MRKQIFEIKTELSLKHDEVKIDGRGSIMSLLRRVRGWWRLWWRRLGPDLSSDELKDENLGIELEKDEKRERIREELLGRGSNDFILGCFLDRIEGARGGQGCRRNASSGLLCHVHVG